MPPICCSTAAEPFVEPALACYWRTRGLETSRFYFTSPRFTCKPRCLEVGDAGIEPATSAV
jgi:hypothetical protein